MRESYYDSYYKAEKDHWWFKVRRELVHFLINKYSALDVVNSNLEILDVGCGTGVLTGELERYGRASGIDFSYKAVEYCKERGLKNVVQGVGEKLPYNDNQFDVVLVLDVLEHIEDDKKAIKELHRVLKPDGILISFVPAFMILWGITDEVSQHFRRYTKSELVSKLKESDFKIIRSTYFNTFLFPPILFVRLISRLIPNKYKPEDETRLGNRFINKVFYYIFKFESILLHKINFPFGVSLAVISKKSSGDNRLTENGY